MKLNGNMFEEFENSNKIKTKPSVECKPSNIVSIKLEN